MLRLSSSVHCVGTAAKSIEGLRSASASSTLKPFAGHGLTSVTKRCVHSHGLMEGGKPIVPSG
eukprot:5218860-Pleurochrysis_carterae.AAC.1